MRVEAPARAARATSARMSNRISELWKTETLLNHKAEKPMGASRDVETRNKPRQDEVLNNNAQLRSPAATTKTITQEESAVSMQ